MRSTDSDKGSSENPGSEIFLSEKVFSQSEKFELLSAYLDGEVSEQEQRLVTQWLASDLQMQHHYHAQLKLRESIQQLATDIFVSNPLPDEISKEPPLSDDFLSHGCSLNAYLPPSLWDNRSLGQAFTYERWVNGDSQDSAWRNGGSLCCAMAPNTRWRRGLLMFLIASGTVAVMLSL